MGKFSFNKSHKPSIVAETLKQKRSVLGQNHQNFKISFQDFDSTQKYGSGFKDWQKEGLLSHTMEVLEGYCKSPLLTQVDGKKFTIYGDFPPKEKTKFSFPNHVPEDARWGRIHINGKSVIVGHIVNDTFYLVFLDKGHNFYLTKRVTEN